MRVKYAGTQDEEAEAYGRLFGAADQLEAEVRYEYLKAGVAIKVITSADHLLPGKLLVDWLSNISTNSSIAANWKYLAAAIDTWAGPQRRMAENDPTRWAQWAENGREYAKIAADLEQIAWENTGVKPVFDAFKATLSDFYRVVTFPVTPTLWPWWLPVGLVLGIAAIVYSKGR